MPEQLWAMPVLERVFIISLTMSNPPTMDRIFLIADRNLQCILFLFISYIVRHMCHPPFDWPLPLNESDFRGSYPFELCPVLATFCEAAYFFWGRQFDFGAFENCCRSCSYAFARSWRAIFFGVIATKKSLDRDNMDLLLVNAVFVLRTLDMLIGIVRVLSNAFARYASLWGIVDS